ncbi:hypothetical protein SCUP515_06596 [Seiridium cupressi]
MDSKPGNVICEICRRRHHPQKLPFFCATDARNALYEGRFANAKAMMEVEELEQRVSALLSVHDSSQAPVASNPSSAYVEKCASDEQKAKDRTEQIMAAADKLRQEVDAARRDIEERRAAIARRKTDLASASQGIAARRNRELEETKTSVRKLKYHWDREHEATAQYRAALCAEVAKLYRLQRVRRGTPGIPVGDNGSSFEDFTFMGRNLYNLLNGSSLQRNQPGQPLINANASSPNRAKTGSGDAENDDITKAAPKMGHWSHGTAHTSLNSAEGQDFTRSFKLPNPIKLADKLKARLAHDAPVPEWELIEDDDFAPNDLDDGVLVGGTPQSKVRNPRYGLESYMSVNTVRSNGSGDARASLAAVSGASAREKDKGTNGWTKIKPR